ncbi:MAG: RNA polymerase factor sigma-54 [Spirochaetaceae bacterium]|nr:RNA polymerase factor sigma-54 [Spirochaetaceae bacterium]
MDIAQRTGAVQEQRFGLRLSPALIQSVKMMEMPIADLRLRIDEELEKNAALELVRDRGTVSLSKGGGVDDGTAADQHRAFIEEGLVRRETLQEHLLRQLHLRRLPDAVREAGELIVQNLSPDGFNQTPLDELLPGRPEDAVGQALRVVRRLEPQGCAVDNYLQSIEFQAELRYGAKNARKIMLLLPYFDDYKRKKLRPLMRKMGWRTAELHELFGMLKTLAPFPGRHFASDQGNVSETRFVVPDVRVLRREDEFTIRINNEEIPVLGIAPFFLKGSVEASGAARDFMSENVKEARWFINALNRRNQTVFRVARAIVHFQRGFFLRGPKYLAPLTQKTVAVELGMHETTVSRAAKGKYMETDWGLFEIRYFFTNSVGTGVPTGTNKLFSRTGVKERILEIVANEKGPLSDVQIVKLLNAQGIRIARRSVTKYRAELDIGSSFER